MVICLLLRNRMSWNCHGKAGQLRQTASRVLVGRHLPRPPHVRCASSRSSGWLKVRVLVHIGRVGNSILSSATNKILKRKPYLLCIIYVMVRDQSSWNNKNAFSKFIELCCSDYDLITPTLLIQFLYLVREYSKKKQNIRL